MSKHKIHIFYHVATLNGYESIVNEQLNSIKNSGILKHSTLSIGVVGNHKIQTNLTSDIQGQINSKQPLLINTPTGN